MRERVEATIAKIRPPQKDPRYEDIIVLPHPGYTPNVVVPVVVK